jgi:EpsD family peptidyl-prolyl cis-trans isomerase
MMKFGRVVLLASVIAMSACEKQPQTNMSEKIATWSSGTVTQDELDHALGQLGKLDEKQKNKVRPQVLDELIDQKLIYSAAEKLGLTNNPGVMLEEELAKRQVVARAYLQDLSSTLPKPTSQEIGEFYSGNPSLFSQRRVYQLQEIRVQASHTQADLVREHLGASENLGDVVGWLKGQNLPIAVHSGVKPAEQLPDAVRDQLSKLSVGQLTLFPTNDGLTILNVQGIQDQPLTQDEATPVIEKLLEARKQKEAIENNIKKLRDAVKIEYASGFQQTEKP